MEDRSSRRGGVTPLLQGVLLQGRFTGFHQRKRRLVNVVFRFSTVYFGHSNGTSLRIWVLTPVCSRLSQPRPLEGIT